MQSKNKFYSLIGLLFLSSCANNFHSIMRKGGPGADKKNPVFFIPEKILGKSEIYFTVEIPKGSRDKYELRTATGQIINDRRLCPRKIPGTHQIIEQFPSNYGISPGRFSQDGDPIDMVVLGGDEKYRSMVEKNQVTPQIVRIIGIMKMSGCDKGPCLNDKEWFQDWKVLAIDPSDKIYANVFSYLDLKPTILKQLTLFWSNYKGYKTGKDGKPYPITRVTGYLTEKQATLFLQKFKIVDRQKEFMSCAQYFQKLLFNKNTLAHFDYPKPDKKFVHCLNQIWFPPFFMSRYNYDFFMEYSAYQLIRIKLKHLVKFDNALSYMHHLKNQNSPHYRFVSYDSPSPGTGNAIFEWVKTKNRNRGCNENKTQQHYSKRPLVDHEYE